MKTYSLTEGDFPHARTSIAQDGDSGNRKLKRDGTADPTSRSAGHARGLETSGQAMGRPAPGLSAVWAELLPGQEPVRRVTRRNRDGALARCSAVGRLFVAVSSSQCHVEKA